MPRPVVVRDGARLTRGLLATLVGVALAVPMAGVAALAVLAVPDLLSVPVPDAVAGGGLLAAAALGAAVVGGAGVTEAVRAARRVRFDAAGIHLPGAVWAGTARGAVLVPWSEVTAVGLGRVPHRPAPPDDPAVRHYRELARVHGWPGPPEPGPGTTYLTVGVVARSPAQAAVFADRIRGARAAHPGLAGVAVGDACAALERWQHRWTGSPQRCAFAVPLPRRALAPARAAAVLRHRAPGVRLDTGPARCPPTPHGVADLLVLAALRDAAD